MKTLLLASVVVAAAVAAGNVVRGAEQYQERLLQDFARDAGGWQGGQVVQEHATEGRSAYRGLLRQEGEGLGWSGNADFSGWEKLKIDTYNEGEPFSVSMIFHDAQGQSYRSWYQLVTRGRGQLEYNLRGLISTVPEPDGSVVALDPARITSMRLVVDTLPSQTHLTIDNVRLSRGPEPRVPMELFRPADADVRPLVEVPGNVIQNGAFELSMAHWNSWGSWDGGDYRFGTVTGEAAHAGSTAATIIAHHVGRGGIYQSFSTPQAGRYVLRFAHRGMGGANRMRVILGPDGQLDVTIATAEQWQIFEREVELPEGDLHIYLYHVSGGTLVLDSISLSPVDGQAQAGAEGDGPAAEGNGNRVEVRGNQVLVNGEPFFPLGFWQVPGVAELQGVNTNLNFWMDLDAAEEAGVMGAVDFTQIMRGYRPDLVVEAARQHANHPALFGWYLCDEPDHSRWNVPPHMVRAAHQSLKEWNDQHATMAIIMSWHRSMAYQYADSADILITLIYTPEDTERVIRAARWVSDRKAEPSPAWIGLQSGWDNHPVPTLENARVQAYAAIANGVTGVFWFELRGLVTRHRERLENNIYPVVNELHSIHDALAAPDAAEQPTSDNPSVHLRLKNAPGGPVLIAVNVSDEDAGEVRISLPQGVRGEEATVEFEDRQVNVQNGAIVDRFGPQERHVYRIGH